MNAMGISWNHAGNFDDFMMGMAITTWSFDLVPEQQIGTKHELLPLKKSVSEMVKLPSGKLTQVWKITILNGKNLLFQWSFSIAKC